MIILVAGGPKDFIPDLKKFQLEYPNAKWCGVDAGTRLLIDNGIIPMVAIGDFDSVSEAEYERICSEIEIVQKLPSEKNQTDLEAALEFVCEKSVDEIMILGATGGRFDHGLSNIMITQRYMEDRIVTIKDKQNEIRMLKPGTYTFDKNDMNYFSLLPITETVEMVTLSGMKYPLKDAILIREESLGVSNEIIHSKGHISFAKGICLVVRSKD
ncbi:MAG: thiamine pyrophosphokinae [Bacillales bacterium]|jgi:thiamine pyrophosphokinase|nr:thiamine pyrophosphokinae [Bacillales bacterium]